MSIKKLGFAAGFGSLVAMTALLSGGAPWSGPALAQAGDPLVVKTTAGLVKGTHDGADVITFKGIPFAQAPVGDLRWRAPLPAKPWTGVRPAETFGHDCISGPDTGSYSFPRTDKSEDCLFVNVWKPAKATKPLAVLVWIYGGGFTSGGTSAAIYDGAQLARQGIMLLSFNYRVAGFGFFAHPALSKEQAGQPRGNYGFLDQVAAMKWIRENIGAFGGDPKNVTVFGESAGGFSVHFLLTSPMAKGLIDKAIVESGGGRRTIRTGQHLDVEGPDHQESGEQRGLEFAKSKGIEGEGPEALAKLRALTPDQILDGGNVGPMIDGTIVPYNMMTAYDSGQYAHVPLIIGANSGDMSQARDKTKDALFQKFGDQEAKARAIYDPTGKTDDAVVLGEVGADQMMHETARFTATRFAQGHAPAYVYRFGYIPSVDRPGAVLKPSGNDLPPTDSIKFGGVPGAAYHGYEIWNVFDNTANRYGANATAQDRAVARMMSGYWVAFAKTGNPNGGDRPVWKAYDPAADQLLIVAPDGKAASVSDPWKARLDLAETVNLKTKE